MIQLLYFLHLILLIQTREPWKTQLNQQLCSTELVISGQRELSNSGFHKDLTTNLELGTIPMAFLLENITSHYYMDLDQIKEGLYLGYPPVFADSPIDVEQPADSSPDHIVGVLCQTHHVTLPVHHRYQPAGTEPYASVCLPFPRVFVPVVTTQDYQDLDGAVEGVEAARGCKLLRAPCGISVLPECGWEEVRVSSVHEVCSAVPVGLLHHINIVKISTVVAILVGFGAIVYTVLSKPKDKAE